MFHRVKSETNSANAPEQAAPDADVQETETIEIEEAIEAVDAEDSLDDAENNEEITAQDTETQHSIETPDTEKETETMNDTAPEANETTTAPYQPTTAGYPGSYPGYAANAAASTEREAAQEGDRRLTIGAGITMSGEIESCDYLLVEGTVEAALKGASNLEIAESGIYYGTAEIQDAEIAGRFEGDITAKGRLTLREGATVTGSIAYAELEIEAGATIDGALRPLKAVQSAGTKPSAARKAAATPAEKVQQAVEAAPAPANTDGGLFTKAAAASE